MKPPIFEHHLPTTLQEALRAMAELENARLIAGGQSLMPMLNFRLAQPDHLIDLNAIAELAYIREDDGEIAIGAMTAQREIEFSPLVGERLPLLARAILSVGHRQTRNRGTIGGSLCHLDPSAELPLMACTMEATIMVSSRDEVRAVKMADFAEDMMTPSIAPDEIVTEIRFKPWRRGHGWGFTEYARRKGDFAIVSAAALLDLRPDGRIDRAALALGGVAPVPIRIVAAEAELAGRAPGTALFARAAEHCAEIEPLDDPFAPGWYRRKLSVSLARRVLGEAWQRAGGRMEI
ncbi:MAG: xanthine dehydrogenase family protein subunit M [Parvibaculaceae bacterium]